MGGVNDVFQPYEKSSTMILTGWLFTQTLTITLKRLLRVADESNKHLTFLRQAYQGIIQEKITPYVSI